MIFLTDTQIKLPEEMSWPAAYSITKAIGNGCSAYCFQVTMFLMTFMSIERWLHMTRRSFITVHRTRVTLVVLLFIPIPLAWALVKKPVSYLFSVAIVLIVVVVCVTLASVAYFKVSEQFAAISSKFTPTNCNKTFPNQLSSYRSTGNLCLQSFIF